MGAAELLASLATGVAVAAGLRVLVPPRNRIADRVRPYAIGPLSRLGHHVDAATVGRATGEEAPRKHGANRWFAAVVQALLVRPDRDRVLQRRLLQARCYGVTEDQVVTEHRVRQVLLAAVTAVAAGGIAASVGAGGVTVLGVGIAGMVTGAARPRARVDAAIERRRRLLRAELPSIAQLLALRIRSGGSITTAMAATAERCQGALTQDLLEALAAHRAGRPLEETLETAAVLTPEPEAARLYRMLASGVRLGLDVAPELLRLARGARTRHVGRMKREATRRRGAMLLPTIGLLAPLLLVFVAAPLPSIISG